MASKGARIVARSGAGSSESRREPESRLPKLVPLCVARPMVSGLDLGELGSQPVAGQRNSFPKSSNPSIPSPGVRGAALDPAEFNFRAKELVGVLMKLAQTPPPSGYPCSLAICHGIIFPLQKGCQREVLTSGPLAAFRP